MNTLKKTTPENERTPDVETLMFASSHLNNKRMDLSNLDKLIEKMGARIALTITLNLSAIYMALYLIKRSFIHNENAFSILIFCSFLGLAWLWTNWKVRLIFDRNKSTLGLGDINEATRTEAEFMAGLKEFAIQYCWSLTQRAVPSLLVSAGMFRLATANFEIPSVLFLPFAIILLFLEVLFEFVSGLIAQCFKWLTAKF